MKTTQNTIEYRAPTTAEQYRFLCGVLLPEIQRIFNVNREKAHKRMREKLIEWGYIKKSRSELNYYQTLEITQRFKDYLTKRGKYIE